MPGPALNMGMGLSPLGGVRFERDFDSDSGVQAALILDYAGIASGQYFANGDNTKTFSDLHTFTRASLATQRNSSGTLVYAPHNLFTKSQEFEHADWISTLTGAGTIDSRTANAGTAPDGTTTADRIIFNLNGGTTSGDIALLRQAVTIIGTATNSVWAKSYDGASSYNMQLISPTGGSTAVTVTGAWQLLTVSGTSTSSINYGLRLRGGATPTNADVADVLLWGAQLNRTPMAPAIDTYATTYVPTTTAAVYQHRLDHDASGNRIGLAVEEARTNYILQSSDFGTTWTLRGTAAVATNDATAPDGTLSADKITINSGAGNDVLQGITSAGGNDATTSPSFYIKKVTASGTFKFQNPQSVANGEWTIDLDAIGSGWERIIESHAAVTVVTAFTNNVGGDGGLWFALPSVASILFHAWGAQYEEGAFPTSHIPTTTVAVTRAAEVATVATSGFGYVDGGAGTILVEIINAAGVSAVGNGVFGISDGADDNTYAFYLHTDLDYVVRIRSSSADRMLSQVGTLVPGATTKLGLAWAENDGEAFEDGASLVEDTSLTPLPTSLTTLYVGLYVTGASQSNIHVKSLTYYAARLSQADGIAGTT